MVRKVFTMEKIRYREIKITKPQITDFKGGQRLVAKMFVLANKNKNLSWAKICEVMRKDNKRFYKACLKTIYVRRNTAVTTYQIGDSYINSILKDKLKSKKFLTNLCQRGFALKYSGDKKPKLPGILSLFYKHFNKRKLSTRK